MNTHDTPFIPAPRITTVAGYLLTRLAEAGLASVFGVPGDRVLSTALRTSRPVYLTIPADVAGIPVLAPAGRLPRAGGDADPAVVAAFTGRARRMLAAAASASLLAGHLAARHRGLAAPDR